ncbi:MAG: alpha/beta hydrolase family protein [Planctomycetota bacterium]
MLGASCSLTPAPQFARPALPLPAAVQSRFALPEAPRLLHIDGGAGPVRVGELVCGDDRVRFHWHRADRPDRPLVLLVPILAGGEPLMQTLARRFVGRGYHAIYCDRAAPALRPPQRGADLERLFVQTVRQQRAALAWTHSDEAAAQGLVPLHRFACGVSMGGMVTAVLTAVEPDLDAAAMCLAGADLPRIVERSAEVRIEQWRRWRRDADGIAASPLRQELARSLRSDPLRLAPHVATDRVFLVATAFDDVVRAPQQDLLWEAFGRPQRMTVPFGHYSAALALDPIVAAIDDFFAARAGAAATSAP